MNGKYLLDTNAIINLLKGGEFYGYCGFEKSQE